MAVVPHSSVEAFFHEVVAEALESQRVDVADATGYYLVTLLGEFTKSRIPDGPLSLKLAQETVDPGERVKTLKEVGDTTLYVSGFFAESLDRSLVDSDFYIGLGEVAYGELAGRLGESSVGEVYRELAAKFPRFVDVLVDVRSRVDFVGSDVVKLYQQWLETRSKWIEHRLRRLGVLIDDGKGYVQ